jgi:hypothetical protein
MGVMFDACCSLSEGHVVTVHVFLSFRRSRCDARNGYHGKIRNLCKTWLMAIEESGSEKNPWGCMSFNMTARHHHSIPIMIIPTSALLLSLAPLIM